MDDPIKSGRRRAILLGLLSGTFYGILVRSMIDQTTAPSWFVIMSIAFIFVVPIVIGFLTVWPHPRPGWPYRLFMPWIPILVSIAVVGIAKYEGAICMLMGLPIFLPLASLGGIAGAFVRGRRVVPAAAFAALPFLVGGVENRVPQPVAYRTVESTVDVRATPERVWSTIVQVPTIAPEELPDALYLRMGFPRPLSATIDRAGVGAMRRATFTGNLVFHETVTDWQEPRLLSFRIAAQTDSIPSTTLDRHVTIGGPYFDVLRGTYTLEPRPDGVVRLRLTSRLRVSTHFNFYAGPWADTIMRGIQETILEVEKQRAEG